MLMDHANFKLAQATLLIVSNIAIELGIDMLIRMLASFGAFLTIFHVELDSKKCNKNDETLEKRLRHMLTLVEKACTVSFRGLSASEEKLGLNRHALKWPACKETSNFTTLRNLAKNSDTGRTRSVWEALFPNNTLHNVRKCLEKYALSTDEFKGLLEEIERIVIPEKMFSFTPEAAEILEEASDYPLRVNEELYGALCSNLSLCECQHSTRLRLDPRDHVQENGLVLFEVLFSTSSLPRWRKTKMLVPSKDPNKAMATFGDATDRPDFAATEPLPEDNIETASLEHFCAALNCTEDIPLCFQIEDSRLKRKDEKVTLLLKDEKAARLLKVEAMESTPLSQALGKGRMPRKTQFFLAYTLAKAVWQYYGSPWMGDPWTRDNIHLLIDQPVQETSNSSSHPFRPYFGPDLHDDQVSTPDYGKENISLHRSPKILALGILLIEVAQGRPFRPDIPLNYTKDSTNRYVLEAFKLLTEDGLFGKGDDDIPKYCRAVEGCLKYDHFSEAPYIFAQNQEKKDIGLLDRRAIIYQEIVHPLEELLVGYGLSERSNKSKQQRDAVSKRASSITPAKLDAKSTRSPHSLENPANERGSGDHSHSLHDSSGVMAKAWIDELAFMSSLISQSGNPCTVRIAVIDTGCNLEAPIFMFGEQKNRLRGRWKDWVEESSQPRDSHGHGTEIISLLLRILPTAEIFIARVARNEQDLDTAGGLIAKAIDHAATVWEADIVTMSFGFPDQNESIIGAIRKAEHDRNESIVFFAAAANEGSNTAELFPANHSSVIAIRGTDCDGAFVKRYNPPAAPFKRGAPLYGTLGKDVPWNWPDEDKFSSGCSIATPIAAAIAALIIQCVTATPAHFQEDDQRRIRKKDAILGVFHAMSDEESMGRHYINPQKLLNKAERPNIAMIQDVLG